MLPNEKLTEARNAIGTDLKLLREKRRLTKEQLANQVGYTTSTISRIEAGRFFPTMGQLLTILHELDCKFTLVENESDSSAKS